MRTAILLLAIFLLTCRVQAQWVDEFNGSSLMNWTGDTTDFKLMDGKLQLDASEAGASQLLRPITLYDSTVWELNIEMTFAPSASNRLRMTLFADSIRNQYIYLDIGENGADDRWYLRCQTHLKPLIIAEGPPGQLSQSVDLSMRITYKKDRHWLIATNLQGQRPVNTEFIVPDTFGLRSSDGVFNLSCYYTQTRKNKFTFDYLSALEVTRDTTGPQIDQLVPYDDSTLIIEFSEPIDSFVAPKVFLSQLKQEARVNREKDRPQNINCTFPFPFSYGQSAWVICQNIWDRNGNKTSSDSIYYMHKPAKLPHAGDLLITEIMADPEPSVLLPDREYIEILNTRSYDLNLEGLELRDATTNGLFPKTILTPGERAIVCAEEDTILFMKYGKTIGLVKFPSLNNDGDLLQLRNNAGANIHSLEYSHDWYQSDSKSKGGWSLEMLNTGLSCANSDNWTASSDVKGGTPGQINSMEFNSADTLGPVLLQVEVKSEWELKMVFDESLQSGPFSISDFSLIPGRSIAAVATLPQTPNELNIVLNDALDPDQWYKLVFVIADCIGHMSRIEIDSLVLPKEPETGELIINELLFNPKIGGVDFIEIWNTSDKMLSLKNLYIGNFDIGEMRRVTAVTAIEPGRIIALSPDRDQTILGYPTSAVSSNIFTNDLPQFPDAVGVSVLMWNNGLQTRVLDSLTYHEDWHSVLLHRRDGVSLERLDPAAPSHDQNNWHSAAAHVDYATPGGQNSYRYPLKPKNAVSLSSDYISPDGDGHKDFLTVSFKAADLDQKMDIQVFTVDGFFVKKLASAGLSGNAVSIIWEGTDEHEQLVQAGNYILLVQLLRSDGKTENLKSWITVVR